MTTPEKTVIRPASAGDLDDVAALAEECFGSSAWRREAFASSLENPLQLFFVAQAQEGALAGFAVALAVADELDIQSLAVAPVWRRHRCGQRLIEALTEVGHARGSRYATLEVRAGNTVARAFYQRLGFAAVGARRSYYHDPDEDAIVMAAHLAPPAVSL